MLAEYQEEGIPITSIDFKGNQVILDLVEGKGGILPTLDEGTLDVKLTDEKFVYSSSRTTRSILTSSIPSS